MKKGIIIILLTTLWGLSLANAQKQWVSFTKTTPEEPTITLQQSSTSAVVFNVQTPGMFSTTLNYGGGVYQRVSIPGHTQTSLTGSPEIPAIKQLIAIPEGTDITLSIQANTPVYLNNYKVFPAPDHQLETTPHNTTFLQEVFSLNDSLYTLNSFSPFASAEIVDIGYIRGQRVAEVMVYPVQFNPATQQLRVISDLEITLYFNGANSPVSIDNGIFSNLTQNLVLNYIEGGTGASVNDRASTPGNVEWLNITDTSGDVTADYIIIAAPEFFSNPYLILHLQIFAQHRAAYNGFDVAIANMEQIVSDGVGYPFNPDYEEFKTEYRIRNFLKSVFENGTANNTHDGKLAYVLLVGDEEVSAPFLVPAWKDFNNPQIEDEIPADYYYSCLTTNSNGEIDNYGDVFIGRFSVDSQEKFLNIVNKTIAFETEYQFDDWKNNILLTSGKHCDDTFYEDHIDEIYPIIPDAFETTVYKMESEGDQAYLFQAMNSGQLITHYRGSGPEVGWNSMLPYLGQGCNPAIQFNPNSDFSGYHFTNADKQGLVISVGTVNGAFDHPLNCMAENLTTPEAGSVLFVTSTRPTEVIGITPDLIPKNDHFSFNIQKALWENLSFVAGEFLLEAQLSTYDYYNSTIANLFMLFGDPALNLMAEGYQVTESVTLSGNINISTDVTIADGVVVTLADDTHVNFGTRGKLIIEEMAGLIVGDSVIFTGQSPENSISIAGYLTMEGACSSEVILKIENGSVVALNNYNTLHMGENAGIIINPGGRLEVSGSTLTTVQNTWPGITVNGNSQLPQSFQNQGALILNNGAVIKNAATAIQTGSNPMINPGNQGGIVQANNVHFINNQRDIEFNSYQNSSSQGRPIDNISYVHYCQFTTDDSTLFSTHHESVQLSDVQGIVFNHCVFTDTRTNLNYPSGETKRTGIVSNDAIFRVYNSDFDQLQYGIYATSTQPNRFFQVHSSDFSTHRGIYFNGMDNVTIINNNLYVIPSSTGECNDRYGIYINQSTNFTIENNNIESQTFS